jgi:hypothetical protein
VINQNPFHAIKHLILALTLTVGFAPPHLQAQLDLPDYYGEVCKETIGFWENQGQIKSPAGLPVPTVLYYSQGTMPRAYFRKNSTMSIVVQEPTSMAPNAPQLAHRLDVRPYGAASVDPVGNELKDHYQKYYLPWCGPNGAHALGYDWLEYPNIYDNIDMVFYSGSAGQKMAFYCWPGSDPTKLALQFWGQDSLKVDLAGFLKIWKNGQWVKLEEAVAYQVDASNNVLPLNWSATYTNPNNDDVIELAFESYDPSLPLVLQIGPTPISAASDVQGLCWNTFYGGNERDGVLGTTTDADGNFYATGYTYSALTFPNVPGSSIINSTNAVVLAKFKPNHQNEWTVFYGGSDEQHGEAVVARSPAEIYITGWTVATDLFTWDQSGAYYDATDNQFTAKGFIAKFDATGGIQWGTYFGDGNEWLHGMALDSQGRLMVAGTCTGTFPAQSASGASSWNQAGGRDIMLARFGPNDALQWCTAYGGSGDDDAHDVVFIQDRAVVLGQTTSSDLPLVNGGGGSYNQTSSGGQTDMNLLAFNSSGTCTWATYLGGNGIDEPGFNGLCITEDGDIAIAGVSYSTNMPVQNAGGFYQATGSTNGAGYLARFNGGTRALNWATHIGGAQRTRLEGVEQLGNKLFAFGFSNDGGLPSVQAAGLYGQGFAPGQAATQNGKDALLMAFDASTSLAYSTYIGGTEGGIGEAILHMAYHDGVAYFAGVTSPSLPFVDDFPLHDPGPPAYFKGTWLAGDFWMDWFVGALCTGSFTGAVGIAEWTGSDGLAVVPIGGGLYQLAMPSGTTYRLRVVDAVGREVRTLSQAVATGNTILDFQPFADGLYVVQVLEPTGLRSVKLLHSRRAMRWLAWLGLLACAPLCAQHWVNAGMPGYNPTSFIKVLVDQAEDRLLVVGYTTVTGENSEQSIVRYRDGAWDTLGTFYGGLADAERLGDTLVVAGASNLDFVNEIPIEGVAAHYDGAWHPYGAFDLGIRNLKLINGELYAIGGFRYVDGQLCNGIAKRVGGGWQCFDPPPMEQTTGNSPQLYDAEIYQGDLYACGVVSLPPNDQRNIIRFNGTSWDAPGGGMFGGFASGRCLTVYQDELYLGGGFTVADGNAGNCIMKWNGSQWSGLNGDLQGVFNDNLTRATALSFLHHDGKLLVGGEFSYVAGYQANRFAVWDGTKWCGYSDTFGPTSFCQSLAVYHDTVFAACGFELNGQAINQVIKWVGDPGFDGEWCNSPIGIAEENATLPFSITPMGYGSFLMHASHNTTLQWRLLDATGRTVQPWRAAVVGPEGALLDLQRFAKGYYVLQAEADGLRHVQKLNLSH